MSIEPMKYSVFFDCSHIFYNKYMNSYDLYRRIELVGKEKFNSSDFGLKKDLCYEDVMRVLKKDCERWSDRAKSLMVINRKLYLIKFSCCVIIATLAIHFMMGK